MSNFYTDNPDILFHLGRMDLRRVVDLVEEDFADKNTYAYAPKDYDDAMDNYRRVLEITGEIAGEIIEPRAEAVDREGAQWNDGVVTYAKGTQEALDRLAKADLMGFTLSRKYGGINMPKTLYSIAIELVSRADAALMNLFGLQDIAETIMKFGTEDQRQRYLPRFANGSATGAMDLTEPEAGSDLQAVMLKAYEDADGQWRLKGVKRFITNGCGHIHVVLARSEEGSNSGSGLSTFIYDREEHLRVRRIEHKLGIHGSPTCELQYNDAPCELLGRRCYGLIKYTMSLMNGARLAIAAQSVGIAEAAYREAKKYAAEREQFKKSIDQFPAVKEMLDDARIGIRGGRSLLYATSIMVDIKEGLESRAETHPEMKRDLAGEIKRYTKLCNLFTPLLKAFTTELCNQVAYDAIQIHGGVGFTTEFRVERHYRDARITNIYEGTTQMQVVAAIRGVTSGVLMDWLTEQEENERLVQIPAFAKAKELRQLIESAIGFLKGRDDYADGIDYHGRRLVDMAADAAISYLLCLDALDSDEIFAKDALLYATRAVSRAKGAVDYIHAAPVAP